MLSTPADLPFFSNCTAASTSLRRMGWSSSVCVFRDSSAYCWISVGLVFVQLRAVLCPSVQYLSFFCDAFSWKILDSCSLRLFHNGLSSKIRLMCSIPFMLVNHGSLQQSCSEEYKPCKGGATARHHASYTETVFSPRKSCLDPASNWTTRRSPDHRKETQTAVVWTCLPFIRPGQSHLARHSERGKKTR